jgi:hypothetical protein
MRLIRWYLPKCTDVGMIKDEQIAKVESLFNNRPRKCPSYKTPLEVASAVILAGTIEATAYLVQCRHTVDNPVGVARRA